MTSTFGSSNMRLKKFNEFNFNFSNEQMQDYLMVKGQIDPIETTNDPKRYKSNEWTKLDQIVYATILMHLFEYVCYMVQLCTITF